MLPHTGLEPRDDPAFLALVDRIIAGLVRREQPVDVHLIHVDNWFGAKWLRYSGKGVVAFPDGYPHDILVALDDHYQDQLTLPPFSRNRIVAQYYFCRLGSGEYEEQAAPVAVHRRRWRWKEQNLHRRVASLSRSGLFIWYSSGSVVNRRGSLLVYGVSGDATTAWYAGFTERNGDWRADHVKGVSRSIVSSLLAHEATHVSD
jgi:hypothetical protein